MTTYLAQAVEAAEAARAMRGLGDHAGARDRAYYASFYAVEGLLEQAGGVTGTGTEFSDSAALREFSTRFVQTGEADSDLGRALMVAKTLRDRADYSNSDVTPREADEAIAAMEKLLAFAVPLLEGKS